MDQRFVLTLSSILDLWYATKTGAKNVGYGSTEYLLFTIPSPNFFSLLLDFFAQCQQLVSSHKAQTTTQTTKRTSNVGPTAILNSDLHICVPHNQTPY